MFTYEVNVLAEERSVSNFQVPNMYLLVSADQRMEAGTLEDKIETGDRPSNAKGDNQIMV